MKPHFVIRPPCHGRNHAVRAPSAVNAYEGVRTDVAQPKRRCLEVEDIGDVTVVNFVDRKILDEQNIQVIGEQLFSLVEEVGRRKLLLNFGNVEYLSSAALGKLITLNKKLQSHGGRLILCNIAPQIYEVFEITKLDKFFKIQKDEQAALQAF
jgi:anti-sigma B factor antagonist